ncbi:hypothetical protein EG328_002223 [Venturia inaequalis]|uniref:Uncharacterized protein n=1 Tax=Venturia inaequalis TaxID=5025 RepID=A0A8H3ZBS4_VENIN|nr:hypothetical protein EG328_002223 [Venturia inaequalis]
MAQFINCTSVSPTCPISATAYGYAPTLAPNAALLTVFILVALSQIYLLTRYRLYSYSLVIIAGSAIEAVGYIGKLLLHDNAWSEKGLRIQIICLIVAPSLLAAAIYLTLKHLVLHFGSRYPRLAPKWYTWIFIGCDFISIVVQALGGAVAVRHDKEQAEKGNKIMIAGIAFQVITMIICGGLAGEFMWRLRRATRTGAGAEGGGRTSSKAMLFFGAIVVGYVTILVRCIYRLPEMAGGWGGELMRNEAEFLVLDGLMVAVAAVAFTVFYPGIFFPEMRQNKPKGSRSSAGHDRVVSGTDKIPLR